MKPATSPALAAAVACAALAACGGGASPPPDAAPPVYSTCPDEPRATAESLAEKAAVYDTRARSLHMHPQMPWILEAHLQPGIDPTTANYADVLLWRSGENDGLWSALYMASQAYRWAVTRDPAARANLLTLLDGERLRMRITGVPGLFTRQLIPPGIGGIACPTDPAVYVPSPDKRGNKWVMIGSDGCAQVADAATLTLASTTHCGLDEFAGWCFLDNVSQDEYVGHMFALGAIARLVDDTEVHDLAVQLLGEIGAHLLANGLEFVDWDGRPTQWGKIHPGAAGDTPGYLAIMGIAFLAMVADATGDPMLRAEHDRVWNEWPMYFDEIALWEGTDGCGSNWNNISMLTANFHHAIWFEPDATRRAALQDLWAAEVMQAPHARAAASQKNAWYNVMWAAQKSLSDGPAYDAVHDAVCQLRQFPPSNHTVAHDTTVLAPHACDDRFGNSLAATPFDIADRCAATYAWWGNPYERHSCADAPELVQQPAGFLLPYWMGRYYQLVPADL